MDLLTANRLGRAFYSQHYDSPHGLMLFVYIAGAGSKSEEALNLLASWAATLDEVDPAKLADG